MALDAQAQEPITDEQKAQAQDEVSPEDVEIVTRMGIQLLMEGGGLENIERALRQSQDPGQVVGQFLAQLIAALVEQLGGQIDLDPRVFLAKGGFLENILDFIESKLGLPSEFSDQVWSEVVEVIKALANDPNDIRQAAPGAPPAQQAAPIGEPAPAAPAPGGMI